MSATQKQAWYHLAVVTVTLVAVLALIPALGVHRAQGGLGFLGFLGLSPLFFRRRGTGIVVDERDAVIQKRSAVIAYSVFWLAFVAAGVGAPFRFGEHGCVPVRLVALGVWFGLMIVVGVGAIATLVQYGRGASNDA